MLITLKSPVISTNDCGNDLVGLIEAIFGVL